MFTGGCPDIVRHYGSMSAYRTEHADKETIAEIVRRIIQKARPGKLRRLAERAYVNTPPEPDAPLVELQQGIENFIRVFSLDCQTEFFDRVLSLEVKERRLAMWFSACFFLVGLVLFTCVFIESTVVVLSIVP